MAIGNAVALAFLAGAVDAIGFSRLGGLFVSFMSGNSTQLGVSVARGDWRAAGAAGGLIACFVLGAGLGSGLGRRPGRWSRPVLLLIEAATLSGAAILAGRDADVLSGGLMAVAMGLENATFVNERGETIISLTYVTGTLVKLGETLATAMLGGARWSWWSFLLLWSGLASGAVVGALGYQAAGLDALYGVSAVLGVIAVELSIVNPARLDVVR